jgi:hypothetical protein
MCARAMRQPSRTRRPCESPKREFRQETPHSNASDRQDSHVEAAAAVKDSGTVKTGRQKKCPKWPRKCGISAWSPWIQTS